MGFAPLSCCPENPLKGPKRLRCLAVKTRCLSLFTGTGPDATGPVLCKALCFSENSECLNGDSFPKPLREKCLGREWARHSK